MPFLGTTVGKPAARGNSGVERSEVIKDKFSIGEYGFIALVVDTKGNMIGRCGMGFISRDIGGAGAIFHRP
jgi:hypothetical protein